MIINFGNIYPCFRFKFPISKAMDFLSIVDKKSSQIAEHLEQQEPNFYCNLVSHIAQMLIKETSFATFERYDLLNCNRNFCNYPEVALTLTTHSK